jgi:hypothetical protein
MAIITPERYILALKKTPVLLKAILQGISQEQAIQMTDGPDGWSVIETLCHIRDYGDVSLTRAHCILEQARPVLPALKPEEEALKRDHKHQSIADELEAWLESRRALIALLEGLPAESWNRVGIHAEYGPMTLLEFAVSVTWHDINHIEQIGRTLGTSGL